MHVVPTHARNGEVPAVKQPGRQKLSRRRFLVSALAAGTATHFAPRPAHAKGRARLPSILPVSHWVAKADRDLPYAHADSVARSKSSDSWQFYSLAHYLDASVSLFEATAEDRHLHRALLYVQNVVNTATPSSSRADSRYSDDYLGWGQYSHPHMTQQQAGLEYPLFESYFFRYAARLLRVMKARNLHAGALAGQWQGLVHFLETHLFEKWMTRNEGHIYRSRTHMASHWAYICLELKRCTSSRSNARTYQQVVDNIDWEGLPTYPGQSLRGQLHSNSERSFAYYWSDVWGSRELPGQDVAHGNGVLSYLAEAQKIGRHWKRRDLRRMVVTLKRVIWPKPGRGSRYVDGSGVGNGWFHDGWIKLSRYDVKLHQRFEQHTTMALQAYANMAVSAAMLIDERRAVASR